MKANLLLVLIAVVMVGCGTTQTSSSGSNEQYLVHTLNGHTNVVYGITWSPDSKKIASGSIDSTVKIWDAVNGKNLLTLKGHTNGVGRVAWSPNGKYIASTGRDKTVRVWDAATGGEVLKLDAGTDVIFGVSWSPDSGRLVNGCADNKARVWEIPSGKLLRTLEGHTGSVVDVDWSPDGRKIASCGGDKTVANALRLLKLDEAVQGHVRQGRLSMGHAKVILGLEDAVQQQLAAERILKDGLSVRASEALVSGLQKGGATRTKSNGQAAPDVHVTSLQNKLTERLGTRVALSYRKGKGAVKIQFYSDDDLERILGLLGVDSD